MSYYSISKSRKRIFSLKDLGHANWLILINSVIFDSNAYLKAYYKNNL